MWVLVWAALQLGYMGFVFQSYARHVPAKPFHFIHDGCYEFYRGRMWGPFPLPMKKTGEVLCWQNSVLQK